MGKRKYDFTGDTIERLYIESYVGVMGKRRGMYKCICECGNVTYVNGHDLEKRHTRSCGCLADEERANHSPFVENPKYNMLGDSNTPLGHTYINMMTRCYNKSHTRHKYYIDKGITVCNEWFDFQNFKKWALGNGYSKNLSLDRKDNSIGYNPENCRWVTTLEQAYNKTNTVMYKYDIYSGSLLYWANLLNINLDYIKNYVIQRNKHYTYNVSIPELLSNYITKYLHCDPVDFIGVTCKDSKGNNKSLIDIANGENLDFNYVLVLFSYNKELFNSRFIIK